MIQARRPKTDGEEKKFHTQKKNKKIFPDMLNVEEEIQSTPTFSGRRKIEERGKGVWRIDRPTQNRGAQRCVSPMAEYSQC